MKITKQIDNSLLIKEIHFPKIQPLPLNRKKSFFGRIKDFFTLRREFIILEDYYVWSEYLKSFIFIPKNFIFDGASVPKALNSLYNPMGMLLYGAGPHDFGYRYKGLILVNESLNINFFWKFSKTQLDKVFNDLCELESGMKKASSVATFALTLFGFTGWNEATNNNRKLEIDFPELFY